MIHSISLATYSSTRSNGSVSQLGSIVSASPSINTSLSGQAWSVSDSSDEATFDDATYDSSGIMKTWSASQSAAALGGVATSASSEYENLMPTRPGFSAEALTSAIADPSVQTFSKGLSTADLALAARQSIDASYAAMKSTGNPFNVNSPGGVDWYTAMGQLDRRALNEVSTNSGGLFTKQEQGIAQSIMSQQQGLAMGLYSGPTDQQSTFADPFQGSGSSARFKAGAAWLDKVSDDEKSSIGWAYSRASVEVSYARSTSGAEYDKSVDSSDPRVALIAKAMGTMSNSISRSYTFGTVETKQDLLNQPWFEGFEDQLDDIDTSENATSDKFADSDEVAAS